MSLKQIKDIISQLNAPNEVQLEEVNLSTNNLYYIWKASNCKLRNFDKRFNAFDG